MSENLQVQRMDENAKYVMDADFKAHFDRLRADAARVNREHGFNQGWSILAKVDALLETAQASDRDEIMRYLRSACIALKLLLVVGEIGEAFEELRKGDGPDSHIPTRRGFEVELADAQLRLMNLATDENLDLAGATVEKHRYNDGRPYKHGGKAF